MRLPLVLIAVLLGATACEQRPRQEEARAPQGVVTDTGIRIGTLWPGPPGVPPPGAADESDDGDATAIAAGERLYGWYNCGGCHFQGGGGIGPPLMDDEWIYGRETRNIVHTILEGRPHGMPSYAGRISDEQVWQIAAYVRSLSAEAPQREERSGEASGADPAEQPDVPAREAPPQERRDQQAGGGSEEEP